MAVSLFSSSLTAQLSSCGRVASVQCVQRSSLFSQSHSSAQIDHDIHLVLKGMLAGEKCWKSRNLGSKAKGRRSRQQQGCTWPL